jgi:hypothetical protein
MLAVMIVSPAPYQRPATRFARTAVAHLCAVALSLGVCFAQAASQQPKPGSQAHPTLHELLSWLPADTETIIGATGPFPLPDLNVDLVQGSVELRMAAFPLGPFVFGDRSLGRFLKGRTLALAVEGSRRSKAPAEVAEFEEMRGEACEIVVFNESVAAERDSYLMNAAKSVARFEEIAGVRFAVFEEPRAAGVWTTFVGFLESNIVLIATNADYLREVLARMTGTSGTRALPDTLPEWKYVNTRAPAWGLRHYDRRMAPFDANTPFRKEKTEGDLTKPDDGAVGVAFSFEPTNRTASVTYLTHSRNGRQIFRDELETADPKVSPPIFQFRLRQPTPGVVQAAATFTSVPSHLEAGRPVLVLQVLDLFLGILGALLGHGAFI